MYTMMKRPIVVVLAAAFAAISTSSLAENEVAKATNAAWQSKSAAVQLSDAELDGITAGAGAFSEVVIFNPGKAFVQPREGHRHLTCINCVPMDVPEGTSGVMNVLLPSGEFIRKTIRQSPF